MGSISSIVGGAQQAHYCSTKAGINLLNASMAIALGPHGITCNVVMPGPVETEINKEDFADEKSGSILSTVHHCAVSASRRILLARLCFSHRMMLPGVPVQLWWPTGEFWSIFNKWRISWNTKLMYLKWPNSLKHPGSEIYWMSNFGDDKWETLAVYALLIRGGGHTILVNSGAPLDYLEWLNKFWVLAPITAINWL